MNGHYTSHLSPVRWPILLMLAALLTLSACGKKRALTETPPGRNPAYITAELEERLLDYSWFGSKISSEVDVQGQKHSFKTTVKMRKDSLIWLSISPALGIEVARMVITPDSVKFIDKWNDKYFIGDYTVMQEKLQLYFDFDILQDLIVGNPLLYDNTEKFRSTREEGMYVLTSKAKPRVRRAAGMRLSRRSIEETADTLMVDLDDKELDRATRNADEEELILKRYYIDATTWKTVRTVVTDLATQRGIEIDYIAFETIEGQVVPKESVYRVVTDQGQSTFEMEYSRIRIDQAYQFPFKVPDKFEPME